MNEPTALLMDVKHFAVHDGPGIRTTLFMKGCSLHCLWCHNPEGISPRPQMAYYAHKCVSCGECARVCPTGAQSVGPQGHAYAREKCIACGACEPVCPGEAMKCFGRRVTPQEALAIALEDRIFYEQSGGGVTLSGGEPLLQADFCAETARLLRREGVTTAIDTCGNVPFTAFEKVLPHAEIFLYDVKHIDSEAHRRLTGQGNEQILSNLRSLSERGARIEVRMPLVPGCNDDPDTLRGIGRLLGELRIERMRVLPYHSLARSKYQALGLPDTLPDVPSPSDERLNEVVALLRGQGVPAVSGRA